MPEEIKQPPGILFLHGSGKPHVAPYAPWQEYLANQGIASFTFHFRGCGESEGNYEAGSLNNRLRDAKQALKKCLELGIDQHRLVVSGASMGGHVAVRLLEKNPWIKAIILQCAAAYSAKAEDLPLNNEFTQVIKEENSWQNSPVFDILETYEGRVYSFYGEHDEVIPQGIQDRFNTIATKKGKAVILPHATHTLLQPKNHRETQAMQHMFDQSVKFMQSI